MFMFMFMFIGVQINQLDIGTAWSDCTAVFCKVFSSSHVLCWSACAIKSIVLGLVDEANSGQMDEAAVTYYSRKKYSSSSFLEQLVMLAAELT